MKINKAKLLVGTLAVIATAATVGSISGTVAWFQYSTRSTVEYSGASAHCTENLRVRIYHAAGSGTGAAPEFKTEWKSDLSISDVQSYIASAHWRNSTSDYNLYPVTSGALASGVATSFWRNPLYQYSGAYGSPAWDAATAKDYIELPLQFHVLDVDGGTTAAYLAKKIYLSDLTLKSTSTSPKQDITDALRVSFDATNDVTFSKNGGETIVSGALDLNNDGANDKAVGYSWDNPTEFIYGGTANLKAVSTKIEKAVEDAQDQTKAQRLLADDSNPYAIIGKELGTTNAAEVGLSVTVRIYLEGWHAFDASDGAIVTPAAGETPATMNATPTTVWDALKKVGSTFNVGMRFSAEAHSKQAAH